MTIRTPIDSACRVDKKCPVSKFFSSDFRSKKECEPLRKVINVVGNNDLFSR